MCIKIETKAPKNFVESDFGDDLIICHKRVDDKTPDYVYMKSDELLYVYCPDGQVVPVNTPGYYKVFKKPVDALWVKKVPEQFKIGVPKESTSKNIGFHAIVSLHLIDPLMVLQSHELKNANKYAIRRTLMNLARQVFETIDLTDNFDEYRKLFNKKLNELLLTTNLNGFAAATNYIGFSTMCKFEEMLKEGTE